MKKLILCVLILCTLGCHGCIPELVFTSTEFRTIISGSIDPSFITVGATTKEQVVLRCGYPSAAVSDDERVFTYSWDTFKALFVQNIFFDSSSPEWHTTYLKIFFDENDIVKNYTLDKKKKD
jgi:hypothetical protein